MVLAFLDFACEKKKTSKLNKSSTAFLFLLFSLNFYATARATGGSTSTPTTMVHLARMLSSLRTPMIKFPKRLNSDGSGGCWF